MYRGRKGSPPLGTWLKRLYNQQFRGVFWVANVSRLKNLTRWHEKPPLSWPPRLRNQRRRKCLRAAGKVISALCANSSFPTRSPKLLSGFSGMASRAHLRCIPTRVHLNKNTHFTRFYDCYYRVFSRGYAKVFSCHPAAHISLPRPAFAQDSRHFGLE